MLILNFDPFPALMTERLELRCLENKDMHEILMLRSDPRVLHYLCRPPETTLQQAQDFILKVKAFACSGEAITWAISLRGNPCLIGTICFWNILKQNHRAEIGFAMNPAYQGKGLMWEAVNQVVQYGFEVMRLHSIEAQVTPENIASVKLLERNHFIREAWFKENIFYEGNYIDTAVYSLMRSGEYPPARVM